MQSKVSRRQGAVSFVFVIVLSKINYVQKSIRRHPCLDWHQLREMAFLHSRKCARSAKTINHSDMPFSNLLHLNLIFLRVCRADVNLIFVSWPMYPGRIVTRDGQFIFWFPHVLVINFMAGKQMICGTWSTGKCRALVIGQCCWQGTWRYIFALIANALAQRRANRQRSAKLNRFLVERVLSSLC